MSYFWTTFLAGLILTITALILAIIGLYHFLSETTIFKDMGLREKTEKKDTVNDVNAEKKNTSSFLPIANSVLSGLTKGIILLFKKMIPAIAVFLVGAFLLLIAFFDIFKQFLTQ